ncbi:hypothetical protein DCE79_05295 [Lysinibacillus sp. 2017]|uniref:hypothetical protein n=1 Tax=unclassified Lysinibacillus TaxID=2636778 RepID=UPI000D528279|nr:MULTISPECIES: hypothetical protein [unclassified Lysinibacillus]AWE06847.1 hypothetical protein DCE79_05295 [Lysinibacillus sp. 2017]TGN37222.1 hypothetical protein E4L99_01700 [Lysinibacillus sp. S2017]
MHPIEIIQLMIASGILVFLLFISFIFKGKRRKRIQGLALLLLVSFGIIYFVRPYWINMQIEKKVSYIQLHLEKKYPRETWEFRIVPHREDGYESSNPYFIGVIFDNEPQVEYQYFARNKHDITIQGFSTSDSKSELLHLE